ncbi:MAG: protein kinase [Nostoc sp. DcaGUA01]|nr:protein kinase [Nostoc sp. DcaGUA01]
MPQNSAKWNVGDIILDLYKVTAELGEGGFGKVYKVRHQGWNIDLAVKIPKPEIVQAAGGVENFEREAETWVNLGLHPHTVSCYYVRRIDGNPVVFAEFVAGGSLHDWIYSRRLYARETETSLKRILDIAIQFAWGLHYAHEQGLIHQDVKPANVMMTAEGVVKVTDFGLANQRTLSVVIANDQERQAQKNNVSEITLMVAGSGAMTPAYCSPEQANRNNLTRRTDLWSWALSVLEMFQGELTWRHGTVAAGALEYYLEQGSEYPHLPQMPIQLAQLLRQCFRENPDERPHDMLEVANELQEIYQQVTGEAYPQQHPQTGQDIADSLNNRAVSLFDLGKHKEALQLWEQALQVQPQHPESTYNRGLVLWRSGHINDGTLLEMLNRVVVKSSPNDWTVKFLLTLIHLERDDCSVAIEILENIERSGIDDKEIKTVLALAKKRLPYSTKLLKSFKNNKHVKSACLSANSRFVLFGCSYGILELWELSTGRCVKAFRGHDEREFINLVCLSNDGRFALSGSSDNVLKLWKVSTRGCLRTFARQEYWNPIIDVSSSQSIAQVGNTQKDVEITNSGCFSPNSRFILFENSCAILELWELFIGDIGNIYYLRSFVGHTETIASICFSADSRLALSGSKDKTIKLWDVETANCLRTFEGHIDTVTSVCFSTDSCLALSGSKDKTIKLWNVETGNCLRTFEGHIDAITSVCFSADCRIVFSGSQDKIIKSWNIETGNCLRTFEEPKLSINSKIWSKNKYHVLFFTWDNKPKIWSIGCLENDFIAPLKLSQILTTEIAISSNKIYEDKLKQAQIAYEQGDYITAAIHIQEARSQPGCSRLTEAINLWMSLYTRLPRKSLQGMWESINFTTSHTDRVTSACFSHDNSYLICGNSHGSLKLREVANGLYFRTFQGHLGAVTSICLSLDGQFLLSGSRDATLKLWEVATGRCLQTFRGNIRDVTSVCLSADNRLAISGGSDGSLRLWEVATGHCLRTFYTHYHIITSVCLSADGRFALFGSENKTLKLWDMRTWCCLHTFRGHTGTITSVCLSTDSRFALSGSEDKTLKLWDMRTGLCLRTFEGHTGTITSVCLSADGRFALSGSEDKTLKLWKVFTGLCLGTFEGYTGKITSVSLSADCRFAFCSDGLDNNTIWILDWELELKHPANWDEGARPYLKNFLTLHTPYTGDYDRHDIPTWSEYDFQNLLYILRCAGYGWLLPEGVHQQLQLPATVHEQTEIDQRKSLFIYQTIDFLLSWRFVAIMWLSYLLIIKANFLFPVFITILFIILILEICKLIPI